MSLLAACAAGDAQPERTTDSAPATGSDGDVVADLAARYRDTKEGGSILFWESEERRAGFAHIVDIYPTRTVHAGGQAFPLPETPRELAGVRYRAATGPERETEAEFTLADFLALPDSIGLLVVKDGRIVFEDYAPGNDRDTRWISFSVTKSVTSLLIGAAIRDGYINSVDDPVTDYVPRLKGSGYDGVTVSDILHMASGVAWNEDYRDENSDVARAGGSNGIDLYRHLASLPRTADPGNSFNYNTGETNLVGAVLRAAIGNNAATYLEAKIWQPFGMESDAYWVLDPDSQTELGGCCLNATLRDYARIGLFAMRNGVLPDGQRVLPDDWMARATAPSPGAENYGYLWWLGRNGSYAARGIFGQVIFVDPQEDLVIAMHGNAERASGGNYSDHIQGVILGIRDFLAD